ncbi:MAG: VOC family protein [Solirubrobacteraceae bacterium]|nr:VOC family protein [Solirubrobacteraceae bacterium]
MSAQDRYIPGVPCWADVTQPDLDAAVAFYGGLFGWEFTDNTPPGDASRYFIARLPGGDVAGIAEQTEGPAAWNTYVWVQDADATAAKVRAAGGTVLMGPLDAGESGRLAVFADPEGAAFRVWQAAQHRGSAVVNAHGSVNFNDLSAADLDGASSFYGAVFGWDAIDIGSGTAWALPGYGEFLETLNPGTLENMAAMGAPERFEDVVASVRVIPADEATRPRWDLTFGVDDADAIAARTAELGGTVVTPPVDAPWSRTCVIRDPAGATFTAAQFVLENKDIAAGAHSTA